MKKITDKMRLDWIQKMKPARIEYKSAWGYFVVSNSCFIQSEPKLTLRQAIDAEIKSHGIGR